MATTMRPGVCGAIFLAACQMLGGCIKPHLYPVCFYQAAPPQQRLEQYYAPQLVSVLQNAAGDSKRTKASVSPDGRWLIANVTKRQNRRLADVWPRVGCLGDAVDSVGTKQEADCVAYLQLFIRTGNYFSFGNARDKGGYDIPNESPVPHTLVNCHQVNEGKTFQP
jgi:hypothetical protein